MCSGVRDQPTPDVFGDLAGSRFWNLGRILAVSADPVPSSYRLPDEFDAVRPPLRFFRLMRMSAGSLGTNLTLQMLQPLSGRYNASKSRENHAV